MEQFGRAQTVIPVRIGTLEVRLVSHDPGGKHGGDPPEGRARVEVIYNNGTADSITVNLANHLSAAQLNALQNLLTYLRDKAVAEILADQAQLLAWLQVAAEYEQWNDLEKEQHEQRKRQSEAEDDQRSDIGGSR